MNQHFFKTLYFWENHNCILNFFNKIYYSKHTYALHYIIRQRRNVCLFRFHQNNQLRTSSGPVETGCSNSSSEKSHWIEGYFCPFAGKRARTNTVRLTNWYELNPDFSRVGIYSESNLLRIWNYKWYEWMIRIMCSLKNEIHWISDNGD